MDAVAFLKTIRQMCKQGCCDDCPWWASCDEHILNYKNLSDSGIEKIVRTAENWWYLCERNRKVYGVLKGELSK